jgi:hypothetical protein
VIPVGILEESARLDVFAQHVRAAATLCQPLEPLLLPSSSARDDDCHHGDDEKHAAEDTADDWGEREVASSTGQVLQPQACRKRWIARQCRESIEWGWVLEGRRSERPAQGGGILKLTEESIGVLVGFIIVDLFVRDADIVWGREGLRIQ